MQRGVITSCQTVDLTIAELSKLSRTGFVVIIFCRHVYNSGQQGGAVVSAVTKGCGFDSQSWLNVLPVSLCVRGELGAFSCLPLDEVEKLTSQGCGISGRGICGGAGRLLWISDLNEGSSKKPQRDEEKVKI